LIKDCYLRLHINDNCDFGSYEFTKLASITHEELADKNNLNKKLRKDIKSNNVQIGNIKYIEQEMIVDVNVNPINMIPSDKIPLSSYEISTNDDPTLETISLTLFVAGCTKRCFKCQNPELQEINKTNHVLLTLDQVKKIINDRLCLVQNLVFCGGDFLPLYYSQLNKLVDFCKSKNLKTTLYTGELFENIDKCLREKIDIIVDGTYDDNKKTNKFPASFNQRCWINGEIVNCDNLKINSI